MMLRILVAVGFAKSYTLSFSVWTYLVDYLIAVYSTLWCSSFRTGTSMERFWFKLHFAFGCGIVYLLSRYTLPMTFPIYSRRMIALQGFEHFVRSDWFLYDRRFFRQRKKPRNRDHEALGSIRLEVPKKRGITLKIHRVN